MIKLSDVKNRCSEDRFFKYDDWRDKLFVPPSIILIWLFLNLGISGNSVSILSGTIAIICGILMANSEPLIVFVGSFGYLFFYLLDYVDGGVARYNKKSGIGGQYVDWIMHVVTTVGITTGLFVGALLGTGEWLIPFGIFAIVASALSFDRYAYAWFAISMYFQQRKTKNAHLELIKVNGKKYKPSKIYKFIRRLTALFYHENYAFFIYPIFSIIHIFYGEIFDFRIFIILLGGLVYFPFTIYDIIRLSRSNIIDEMYNKTFIIKDLPNLPNDHFFE